MDIKYEYKPSEGEEFLEDYFTAIQIKYESQKKISNLRNDVKQFRYADFYLPKYKIYVEFFGLWNNTGNDDYKQKKEVYRQNGIPCVYLYPENLGIIDFTFDKRIQTVLKKYNKKKELHSYRFFKLKNSPELKQRLGFIALTSAILIYELFSKRFDVKEYLLAGILSIILLYQSYQVFQIYLDIFKRNKFALHNVS